MTPPIIDGVLHNCPAVISGTKVKEDDRTRWVVFCYFCKDILTEGTIDPEEQRPMVDAHNEHHLSLIHI